MKKRKPHRTLKILNTIFAALYFTAYGRELIAGNVNFNADGIGFSILALVFLIGFLYSWKHELKTGFIYLGWNVGVWILELFFEVQSGGFGIISGIPILVLAIFFIIIGVEKRDNKNQSKTVHKIGKYKSPG